MHASKTTIAENYRTRFGTIDAVTIEGDVFTFHVDGGDTLKARKRVVCFLAEWEGPRARELRIVGSVAA